MKKSKKVMLTTAAFAAAFAAYSCDNTEMQDVYGPPPDLAPSTENTTEFDPSQQDVQDVYGPPPVMEEEIVESTEKPDIPENVDISTSVEEMQVVYGPPPDMG